MRLREGKWELMTRLYKWLLADDRTPIQNVKWAAKVGEWTQKETPVICKSGWHGMREQDVLSHLPGVGAKLYVVETRGEMVHGSDKFAAESMRLVRILGVTTEQNLRLFMCDVAEDVLPIYEAWAPGDDRRARKSIEAGRAFALDPTNETKAARAAEAARQDAMNKYSNWLVCRIESDI